MITPQQVPAVLNKIREREEAEARAKRQQEEEKFKVEVEASVRSLRRKEGKLDELIAQKFDGKKSKVHFSLFFEIFNFLPSDADFMALNEIYGEGWNVVRESSDQSGSYLVFKPRIQERPN